MESIANYLKEKCLYDRLKDRIKNNLTEAETKDPHATKVKHANEFFECFRGKQDCVLALYLIWDALDTLKLNHTMYLFRNETGFDPTKIANPHILKLMHELVRDRRHCDVILQYTIKWYTKDYTPQTDKCCQNKLLEGLVEEVDLQRFRKDKPERMIEKKNLLDGDTSPVTVSIHLDGNKKEPQIIAIPRDTTAKNIQIYLKAAPPRNKIEFNCQDDQEAGGMDSDTSVASTNSSLESVKTEGKKLRWNRQTILGNDNDDQGIRRGFRRSPSPSRSSIALKGGGKATCDSDSEDGYTTDSYSYIHNPELHKMFMEELCKVKKRKRAYCTEKSRAEEKNCEVKCGKKGPGNVISPPPQNIPLGETVVLTGCLVKQKECAPIPHLVTQCQQAANSSCFCGHPMISQAPPPRPCSPQPDCFNEQVRRGTEDLINCSEVTRRFQQVDLDECNNDQNEECSNGGLVQDIARRVNQFENCENMNRVPRFCGARLPRQQQKCTNNSRTASPNVMHFRTDGQCSPSSMRNVHPNIPTSPICQEFNAGDTCNNNYQPDILSEFD